MTIEEWKSLSIGDPVTIMGSRDSPPINGSLADKIHESAHAYTLLIKVGQAGKRPLLRFVGHRMVRKGRKS